MTKWTTRTREVLAWNALLLASLSLACGSTDTGDPNGADTAQGQHAESMEAGANGGRLLRSGAFELELGIFERGEGVEQHVPVQVFDAVCGHLGRRPPRSAAA